MAEIRLHLDDDGGIHTAYGIDFTLYREISGSSADIKIIAWGYERIVRVYEGNTYTISNPDNINDRLTWQTIAIGSAGVSIDVQSYSPLPESTLNIDNVIVELSPAGDLLQYNRYGVYFEVHVSGTGKGSLKIDWGTDHSETKTGIVAGDYAYIYNLPPGTHNVCAELFNVVG
ncbi:MAG: hypothetical protein KAJ19_10655 [Gammaproteobacteria bacterium]|nr:hypothetical protein [Gammaproteobacteria bacterium]